MSDISTKAFSYDDLSPTLKKWQEVTFRKGAKSPRVCRDIFISKHWEKYRLVVQKNGRITTKISITKSCANKIITENNLISVDSGIFKAASTFRTPESVTLIYEQGRS